MHNLHCIKWFVYSDIQFLNSGDNDDDNDDDDDDDDDTKCYCSSEIMLSQMYSWSKKRSDVTRTAGKQSGQLLLCVWICLNKQHAQIMSHDNSKRTKSYFTSMTPLFAGSSTLIHIQTELLGQK